MKRAEKFRLVLVTAPNLKAARALAKAALRQRLAACANLVPKIESHYWWQAKLESSPEVLLIFKTTARQLADLEQTLLAGHPYDTPEIIALPFVSGTPRYLNWLAESVASKPRKEGP
jgi:periplasmic divalent cation tolerance protein